MIASCSALCVWTDEIRSIAVYLKDHVTGAVDDFCIRVASSIVEEVDCGIVGGDDIGAGSNVIKGMHHGVINGAGIEEKFSPVTCCRNLILSGESAALWSTLAY